MLFSTFFRLIIIVFIVEKNIQKNVRSERYISSRKFSLDKIAEWDFVSDRGAIKDRDNLYIPRKEKKTRNKSNTLIRDDIPSGTGVLAARLRFAWAMIAHTSSSPGYRQPANLCQLTDAPSNCRSSENGPKRPKKPRTSAWFINAAHSGGRRVLASSIIVIDVAKKDDETKIFAIQFSFQNKNSPHVAIPLFLDVKSIIVWRYGVFYSRPPKQCMYDR